MRLRDVINLDLYQRWVGSGVTVRVIQYGECNLMDAKKVMRYGVSATLALAMAAGVVGCANPEPAPLAVTEEVVRVNGLGVVVPRADLTHAQQRLAALRASRVDAYRNLAEQVYGLQVTGNTTVRQMAVTHDHVRTFVQQTIRGATVVDIDLIDDDTYQTTVELRLGPRFFVCVGNPAPCSAPVGSMDMAVQ